MIFDLKEALDFADSKYSRKVERNNESKRKIRRVYYEASSIDNVPSHIVDTVSAVVSSSTLDMNTNDELTCKMTDDILSKILFEEDGLNEDNIIDVDDIRNNTINYIQIFENTFDNLELSNKASSIDKGLLHHFTNMTREKFCSTLLSILRDAHISKSHANRLLSFIHSILPIPNAIPTTMEELLTTLEIKNYLLEKYLLCTSCNNALSFSQNHCQNCFCSDRKCFAVIYDMNVEELIKENYTRLKWNIIEYREHLQTLYDRDGTNDIGFNRIYQELLKDNMNNNFITFLLHLDGISLSKSSNLKMWLFSGSIIELRPQLRNRRYNMVLFSLWFSYNEPNAQIWLRNCVNVIKFIKMKGIIIDHEHRINVKFLSVTGDSPALRNILNFNGHGGYFCCNFCYIRGQHIGGKRQYYYEKEPVIRHSSTYYKESIQAEKSKKMIYGHKGKSILQDILDTQLPEGIIIDYQHVSLLRHGKTVLNTIYKQFIPSHREIIDNKLKNQCFPHFFNRRMKPFKNLSFIKAVELRNVLIYGFLPLSYEFMNREQLAHIALYLCAIRLYHSQPPIFGQETAAIANQLFQQYYKDHTKFYHLIQHYVLHLHSHYGNQYINYGSLANIGCFSQEDLLGHISSNTHGTRYYGDQIVHYYNIDFSLSNRTSETIYEIHSRPIDLHSDFVINNYSIIIEYHNRICDCLNVSKCISIYRRCIIRNYVFHSLMYKRRTKSNSYVASYYNAEKYFGIIHLFFNCINTTYVVIQRFRTMQKFSSLFKSTSYFNLLQDTLDSCFIIVFKEPSDIYDVVEINHIMKHCIVFDFQQQLVITEVSAYYEHD